jgi:hypothetical protein
MSDMHIVKSWPWFFQAIKKGSKAHDLRKMDRDWKVGDQVTLREFDPIKGEYTGDEVVRIITFITNEQFPCAYSSHALDRGYVILSFGQVLSC